LVVYVVGEWLIFYKDSRSGLVAGLIPILMAPALWASLKINDRLWLKRANLRGETDRFAAYALIVVPAFVVAYAAANLAASPLTTVLNGIQPPTVSPTPSHLATPSPSPSPSPSPTSSP